MRATACLLVIALAGCRPSATIQNTMPVTNLQSYRTVGLRVKSSAFASQGMAMYLEGAVLQKLQQQCGFEQVARAGATAADVMLDLNITASGRGGGGFIQNQNLATLDTLLVLSDGQTGELLGTARIHGESSGALINNSVPENEAVDVVAKTIADLLAKSGCTGPRVARAEPPPAPNPPAGTGSGSGSSTPPPGVDESHRAEAEALNEQGKDKLRGADINGALAAFQQAVVLLPDPRYEYNVCLAFEAQQQWDQATASCQKARGMNPEARLVTKIDHRLELLHNHQ